MNSIMITGGTGSFGRACVRKLLDIPFGSAFWHSRIVIYSRDEHKQEQMAREFENNERLRFFIGDVRDRDRLILGMAGCYTVIHAAAMKIVPTAEYNPMECIKTNVMGAQNVIDAAMMQRIQCVMALSTDKAVNPLNLYGASKLCAEKLFLASNNVSDTRFSVVRYGNVANSNGSVIPLFKEQLSKGLPLTVTHEDMTRYWITLDEAVDFVLGCIWNMKGGEVFLPDMPSFKVMDLARATSDKIRITGIRPGEKLHEQIDQDKYSNINDAWLDQDNLKQKLKDMGAI